MLTRNWYNAVKAFRARNEIKNGFTTTNGTITTMGYNSSMYADVILFCPNYVVFTIGQGIAVGSGVTSPTIDDYKLENQITSGLSYSITTTMDENNDTVWCITLTNSSSEDITIGEIGCYGLAFTRANNSSSSPALYDRTVLDEPVTIPAGGVGQVTYTIHLNYPTA